MTIHVPALLPRPVSLVNMIIPLSNCSQRGGGGGGEVIIVAVEEGETPRPYRWVNMADCVVVRRADLHMVELERNSTIFQS